MGRSLAAGAALAGAFACGGDKTGRSTRAPHGGSGFDSDFELDETTMGELQEGMEAGR